MLISTIDKSVHSCGYACRYLNQIISNWTPFDLLFLTVSQNVILESIIFMSLILYFSTVTYTILLKRGVSLLGVKFFGIGHKRTTSQAMIFASALFILSNFGWFFVFTALSPQYVSFGNQLWCNSINIYGSRDCTGRPDLIYSCQASSPIGKIC